MNHYWTYESMHKDDYYDDVTYMDKPVKRVLIGVTKDCKCSSCMTKIRSRG